MSLAIVRNRDGNPSLEVCGQRERHGTRAELHAWLDEFLGDFDACGHTWYEPGCPGCHAKDAYLESTEVAADLRHRVADLVADLHHRTAAGGMSPADAIAAPSPVPPPAGDGAGTHLGSIVLNELDYVIGEVK